MKKIYIDCDRCGIQIEVEQQGNRITSFVDYLNASLCLRCNKIRQFDDENPILYSRK